MRKLTMALLAATSLSACATTGNLLPGVYTQTGKDGPILMTESQPDYAYDSEDELGLDAVEAKGEFGESILRMEEVENALASLLAPLLAEWPYSYPAPPQIRISMASEYAAKTAPNGVITVSLGTLDELFFEIEDSDEMISAGLFASSDEELTYLLGHEFSHYALAHHNRSDMMSKFQNVMQDFANIRNTASALSEMRYQSASGGAGQFYIEDESKVASDVQESIATYDLIETIAQKGLASAWGRSQEDEADVLAYDMMRAVGMEGDYYVSVFNNLKQEETFSEQLQSRLTASLEASMANAMSDENVANFVGGNFEAAGGNILSNVTGGLKNAAFKAAGNYFGQTHRNPDVRRDGVRAYELNAYGEGDPFAEYSVSTTVLDGIRQNSRFLAAKIATIGYIESQSHRTQGRTEEANIAINRALSTAFNEDPNIRLEASRVAEDMNMPQIAISHLMVAVNTDEPNPAIYNRLARVQTNTGDFQAAECTLSIAETRIVDKEYFLPTRILIAARQSKADRVIELIRECRTTRRDDLVVKCLTSSQGLDAEDLTQEQIDELDNVGKFNIGSMIPFG